MPKFEAYNDEFNGTADITLKPSKGDMRLINQGTIEQMDEFGVWNYICNIEMIDRAVLDQGARLDVIEQWKVEEDTKAQDTIRAVELEAEYHDLKQAGDSLAELEAQGKTAREYMSRLEHTIQLARTSYRELVTYTGEKQRTFDILDTDLTAEDNTVKEPS
jgi:hypothetical protein